MSVCKSIMGVAIFAVLLGQGAAQAEPYMGLGLGQSTVDVSGSDIDTLAAADGLTTSFSVDASDTAWKIFGGYKLNENFAVEAAYVGYGTISASSSVSAPLTTPVPGRPLPVDSISIDYDASAWIIDAVGILPLVDGFDLFAKAGVAAWEIDKSASALGTGLAFGGSPDADGADFHFGLGASLATGDYIAIRAEWERISADENLDAWTLGMEFRFE